MMSKFTMSPCGGLRYSEKTLRAGSREAVVDKTLSLVRHDDIMAASEKIWRGCGALWFRHNPEFRKIRWLE